MASLSKKDREFRGFKASSLADENEKRKDTVSQLDGSNISKLELLACELQPPETDITLSEKHEADLTSLTESLSQLLSSQKEKLTASCEPSGFSEQQEAKSSWKLGNLITTVRSPESSVQTFRVRISFRTRIYPELNHQRPFRLPNMVCLDDQISSHGGQFTELLNFYRSKGEAQSTAVSAISSAFYELKQWDTLFKRACGMDETLRWMEDCIECGKPVYFIVGFRTFLNPSTAELSTSHSNTATEVKLPISAVAAANLPVIQLGNMLDPGALREVERDQALLKRGESEGEMVFAVQYCRVGFKWFSSRKVEKASLGEGRWKINWGVRSKEELEEEDVVEAALEVEFDDEEDGET